MTSSNFRRKKRKNYFFNLFPKVFTQISRESTCSMKKLIPHPRSTHVAYLLWTLLHKKLEIYENMITITFFHVFLIFHVVGSIESLQNGYSLDEELNFASNEYSHSKFE